MKLPRLHPVDLGFIALVAAYILACWVIVSMTGHAAHFMPLMYLDTARQMTVTFLLGYLIYRLLRAAYIMVIDRPRYLASELFADLKDGPLRPEMLTRALPLFIAFIFFFSTFTSMKFLIADIKPFAWDEYFMEADKTIHFDFDPWRLLQPFLGNPFATHIIAFVYILWLPAFFLVLYWQLFRFQNDALRMRFFYTFVLTWAVNGTFLAIYFSSAGPCYYTHVTGSDYYAPLMDYLHKANEHYQVYSVSTQDLLWKNYKDKGTALGGGVSAFPSVHVATTFLFLLMAKHINKISYLVFFVFFLLILIGSVHLGWHYAVDGYCAILTTWMLWGLSGKITKRLA